VSSTIHFTKMSGAGNDFVVIDNRSRYVRGAIEDLARAMCPRKKAVGADGLIIVEVPLGPEDFSMRYYNSDGSEADLCGNGARCVAVFAHARGIAGDTMSFSSAAGLHTAVVTEGGARVSMPDPVDGPREVRVPFGDDRRRALFLIVGVPHVIVFDDDPGALKVDQYGPPIRNEASLGPQGANVDFVKLVAVNRLRMRTYERGVEAETLACGTGAVASAVAACAEGLTSLPVEIETAGGDVLRVHGHMGPEGPMRLELEGPACVVYEGRWAGGGA
jgi:diaminopimelate epimerase